MARVLAALLVALLLAPSAAALAAAQDEVNFRFDDASAPLVLAAGRLDLGGLARDGLLAANVAEARLGPIPELELVEAGNGTLGATRLSGATLVVHSGHLLWRLENASVALNASAEYAFALALPESPFAQGDARSPGLVAAGPGIVAGASWPRGEATLVPYRARITVLDASGAPVPGWSARDVNMAGSVADVNETRGGIVVRATGAFEARLPAQALIVGLGADGAAMRVEVRASPVDRFDASARAVQETTSLFTGDAGGATMGDPLAPLGALSPLLNGGVLLLDVPGAAEPSRAIESRLGDRDVETGPFTLLRSQDLALAWGDGELAVGGTSKVAVTREGFSVDPPLVLGFVPVISALLWLGAAGAVAYFFVKRPPESKGQLKLRLASTAVWGVVLVLVFLYWDWSFADTFGTSVLTVLREGGFDYAKLSLVFGLEMAPWALAALLFALPVRIALGVGLRYRGEGSSYKRLAMAGGLVSLAIFGPLYALWIVNVVIAQVIRFAPKLFG